MTACQVLSNALIKEDLDVIFSPLIIPFLLGLWNQSQLDPTKRPRYHWPVFSLDPRISVNLHEPKSDRLQDIGGLDTRASYALTRLEPLTHQLCLP